MNMGDKIEEFELSSNTVKDFNGIFDVQVFGVKEDDKLEYAGCIFGKPDHRLVIVNDQSFEVLMIPSYYKIFGNTHYKYTTVVNKIVTTFPNVNTVCDYLMLSQGKLQSMYCIANSDIVIVKGETVTRERL